MITKLNPDISVACIDIERLNPNYVIFRAVEGIVKEAACCDTAAEAQQLGTEMSTRPGIVKVAGRREMLQ